jgi:hypothetical protein
MMLRPLAAFPLAVVLLTGCGNDMKSKERVQAAILERIQSRTGLDLKSLDVSTTAVSFDKNMAYATVAFHPKGDTTVSHGMAMKYTLEDRGGKWVVVGVSNPQGGGMMGQSPGGSQLPPGHPSLDGAGPAGAAHLGNPHDPSSKSSSGANGQTR